MNTKLINKNFIIISDMQPLYLLVAKQTSSTLYATKTRTNPDASYRKLNKVSKLQANLKEVDLQPFLGHFLYGLLFSKFNRC